MTAKIKLNAASGGGSFSLQAPSSSANNRVISLPDLADGTLLTSQSSLDSTKLSPALAANTKITRVGQGSLNGVDSYTYTSLPSGIVQLSYMWYGASLASNTNMLFRIGGGGGGTSTSGYYVAQAEIGDGTDSVTRSPRTSEIPVQTDSWEAATGVSQGRIDFTQAEGNLWTWKMQNYYYATASGHYVNMLNTGYITIAGALERAVLFSGGGANFDAGYVYLTYTQIV